MKKVVQKNRKGTEEGAALCHGESSLLQELSEGKLSSHGEENNTCRVSEMP